MRYRLFSIISAVLLASTAASAQRPRTELGIGVDWRRQIGANADVFTDRRKGLAIRLQGNVPWKKYVGFRVEGSYVQVQYNRIDSLGATGISETDFEAGGFLRAFIPRGNSLRPYILGGAVASFRASCDLNNAFASTGSIRCAPGEDYLLGWGAGAGAQFGNWLGVHWFAEARVLGRVTAASGGKFLAISIGAGM